MSQVQFSGSCSQDSGPQGCKSQMPGTQFWGPGCQGPSSRVLRVRVSCLRVLEPQVPDSRVSESQGLESQCPCVPGLRVSGSRVSGPDFRLCHLITFKITQKQAPEKFCKKAVHKNFAIFTGKHLRWRLFLIQNIAKFL